MEHCIALDVANLHVKYNVYLFVSSDHEEDVSHLGSGTLTGIKLDDVYFYVF